MKKRAAGKQISGYMQSRSRTRPYRAETLLNKDLSKSPSEAFAHPVHDAAEKKFDQALASDVSDEFVEKESSKKCSFCEKPAVKVVLGQPVGIPVCNDHVQDGHRRLDSLGADRHHTVKKEGSAVELVHLEGEDAQRFGQQYPDAKVRDRDVVAAKVDGKIVGGIVVKPGPDEHSKAILEKHAPGRESSGHVSFFFVDKDRRHRGIGQALMNEALKGRPNLSLCTDNRRINTNEAAVRLYERSGFEPLKKERRSTYWMQKKAEEVQPTKREFAPGIRAGRKIRRLPRVPEKGPNADWTVSLSKHPAAVRGDHLDLRLVDSRNRAHSWAINDIPKPGQSTYAAQTATHSGRYAKRTEPFTIPLGVYGGTRPGARVEPVYVQGAEVISADDKRVHFLRHKGQETEEFVLRRVATPPKGAPLWVLHNSTKNRDTKEGKLLPNSKQRYKEIPVDAVDFKNGQQVMTPKLDGAHVLVQFPKAGKMQRVFSYRPTDRESGLIEHTFKFPDFQKRKVPPGLQGTIIRAEAWASDENGRAVPAPEVGGLLNSSVPNSRRMQADRKLTLRLTGHDVVRHKGREYSGKGFEDKIRVLDKVRAQTKGLIEAPVVARNEHDKRRLLNEIKVGRFPETKEGVVLHELNTPGPPTKVKIKQDHDVYVREIYSKPKTEAKGQAAGFAYSLEPDGPVVGRVGTGLSQQMRQEMASSPEKFVGRVAKVRSAGRHQPRGGAPGALVGSPVFKEWHVDKTPPELMKEGGETTGDFDLSPYLPIDRRYTGAVLSAAQTRPTVRGLIKAIKGAKKGVDRVRSYIDDLERKK